MVYVQTTFDLDDIGYSATLPTYRTVLRREHRLSESEDEHLRRCSACSEARPMIDWTIGHHGDRRAVVVEHNAVADLVGRPGATGMLVPMRFPEGDAGPSYTVQSLHDRDALVLALQNSSAPDYEEVFSHRDAGAGSSVWAADGGRTYLRGPLEETVDWFDCFFCTTYVVGSRLCRLRLPYQVVVQNDWTGVAVEHTDLERLFQRKGATCVPRAVGPRRYDPESVHQFRDLKAALVAVGAPLRYPDQRVAVQLHDSRTYLSWRTG